VLLVDTSAWIELFQARPRLTLAQISPDFDDIVTCLPVIQEVLQGFDNERAFQIARSSMYSLPCVESPLSEDLINDAVDLYRRTRRAGVTVRSSVDCLIAACAARHHLTIVHCDRDYRHLARIIGVEHRDVTPRVS
jgi:predicted nucleic acid-binding protein